MMLTLSELLIAHPELEGLTSCAKSCATPAMPVSFAWTYVRPTPIHRTTGKMCSKAHSVALGR